jgi:two-component system sensor histidine kinase RpfC
MVLASANHVLVAYKLGQEHSRMGEYLHEKRRAMGRYIAQAVDRLRAFKKALYARSDPPEFEQACIRLGFGLFVLIAFLWYLKRHDQPGEVESQVLLATIAYCLASLVILSRVLWTGGVSVARRYAGMVIDNAGITYFMAMMGDTGAVMFGLYLFIIFGNGFRYGRVYLHVCQGMGLVGFGAVLLMDNHWSASRSVGLACFFAMIVLPFYVSVLAQRITDARKRADEANQAKGRFLAIVSHEMRTPLNGVIAMADVLRETNLNESQREIVATLGTSAHLLLAQIEDVLDMAKIEAGRVQIERRPFDLGKLLTSTVKVILPQARYKDLAVNTAISPHAMRWFSGDSHHLRQVLLNLLSNAVKFTERGEIALHVTVVDYTAKDAQVRFEVRDTGIGIPVPKQAIIFEPFTQADDSITRVYGGTGLGTTIARQLVALMGGKIGVVSTVGLGSTFWFEVPLPHAEPVGIDLTAEIADTARLSSAAAVLAAQQPTKITKIRGARVLVAEDNATNQRVAQLILESGGHTSTIVDNGEAALDALEHGSFDLALFDLSMPGVSGLEALKLYQYTTQNPIPVLILSANVTTEVIAECQRAGCAEFIAKPIRATTLLEAIERQLAEKAGALNRSQAPIRSEERPALTVIDTPPVDHSVLEDLCQLSSDPTFVDRLIRGFRSDTERLLQAISDALAARRYEDVKDVAHAIKGGAGSVGATQLVQLAVRFEKSSYDTLRTKAAAWTEELTHAANAALAALEQHLEERRRRTRS